MHGVFRCDGDDVEVFCGRPRNDLFRFHFLESCNLVTKTRSLLVFLVRGCALHAFDHAIDDAAVLAFEKEYRSVDVFGIGLPVDVIDARRGTAFYLVLQARPGTVIEFVVGALPDEKQLLQFVQGFADGAGARIRAEIAAFAFPRTAVKPQSRKRVIRRHIYIRVTLVVSQDYVKPRFVPFDQVVFEDQRFGFGIGDRDLDISNQRHHRGGLGIAMRALEVTGDALPEIHGFADVDDLMLRVEHLVDARPVRQAAYEGFRIELAVLFRAHRNLVCPLLPLEQQLLRTRKHLVEHVGRQAAGVGVVAAAVIAIEQQEAPLNLVFCRVRELEICLAGADRLDDGTMGDAAECQHDGRIWQCPEFRCEEFVTGVYLGTDRLVIGRQALDSIGDPAIDQSQFIVGRQGFRVAGEAELVQRLVEKHAGVVTGKRPAGAVGAVHAWRQADDEQSRPLVAERRHGKAVITGIVTGDTVAEIGQSLALPAGNIKYFSHPCAG